MIIAKPVPATVGVVICEPRGLSNPITMGIKTSKLNGKGRGKVVRLQQRLSMIWWLTYANKSENRASRMVVKLAMIKK